MFLIILSTYTLSSEFKGRGLDKKVSYFKGPKRQHSVIISEQGYFPKSISIFEGETIDFYITSIDGEAGCMVINEVNLFASARKGQIVRASAHFKSKGNYKYYCPATNATGTVVVLPKQEKKPMRKIASEVTKGPSHWMPKDY